MDKRTLLAIVLMMGIWLIWTAVFSPPLPESTEEIASETGSSPTPVPVESVAVAPTPDIENVPSGWLGDAGAERGASVRVETELFEAQFDRVGGDLISYRLRQFRTLEPEPELVELVNTRELGTSDVRAHGLALVYEDGRRESLARVALLPDRESLRLSAEHPTGSLTLRAAGANGNRVELELRFANDRFGFDAQVRHYTSDPTASPVACVIDWPGGIAASEPDSVAEYQEFRAYAAIGEELHKKKFNDLRGDGQKGQASYEGSLRFAGAASQYFGAFVVLPLPALGAGRVELGGNHQRAVQTFSLQAPMHRASLSTVEYSVFLGPLDARSMHVYQQGPYSADLDRVINLGPTVFRPIAAATLWCLNVMYRVLPNYGWVIILFSALTKLLFYPLTKSSTLSMKRMQEMQPEMARLREKYKDDQQRQSQEMMALYKKHGVNPVGGCLPLLVQMPVFIVLFQILRNTIELRQAHFFGWIDDLSRPDVLYTLPFSVPLLGSSVSLLPFLMAISMWWQTKLSAPTQPQGEGIMAMNARMMGTLMPIMMFFLFYRSPSGLVLYWLVNTVLTALQTWEIHRKGSPTAVTA